MAGEGEGKGAVSLGQQPARFVSLALAGRSSVAACSIETRVASAPETAQAARSTNPMTCKFLVTSGRGCRR